MNTTQLECFLAVAEFLNFSRAAQTVQITQPAVTHQIHALEKELGVPLFNRSSKNVELTQAGLLFIPDAERILQTANSARIRLNEQNGESPVPLDIGCRNTLELNLLPPVLHQLSKEFKRLQPSIKLLPFHSIDNLMQNGAIQLMFGFQEPRRPKNQALGTFHELAKCPITCVCSKTHPLAACSHLTEDQLTGPLILFKPNKEPHDVLQLQNRLAGKRRHSQLYFGDGYETVMTLVRSGIGFCLFPRLPNTAEPGLRYLPVEGYGEISFGIFYRSPVTRMVVKRFLQLIKESISLDAK